MKLYCGIDLHSTNNVITVLDEEDRVVYQRRGRNLLHEIVVELNPFASRIEGVVVEATFNWYWLVDGLIEAGYKVHLANPAATQQYKGLKHRDDVTDSQWLARLLRLGILPEGYIYPKAERAVRDLLRKRTKLVQQRTKNLLGVNNLIVRNIGCRMTRNQLKRLDETSIREFIEDDNIVLAICSTLAVIKTLNQQIGQLEKTVKAQLKLRKEYKRLLTISGVGEILAMTIMVETGDIRRFASVGNFASYCRCVDSGSWSNGKRKGRGNTKNGNKYLSWAFMEAAHFAVVYEPRIRRFHDRKQRKVHPMVARKSVAHKLARACYRVIRDNVDFDIERAFS